MLWGWEKYCNALNSIDTLPLLFLASWSHLSLYLSLSHFGGSYASVQSLSHHLSSGSAMRVEGGSLRVKRLRRSFYPGLPGICFCFDLYFPLLLSSNFLCQLSLSLPSLLIFSLPPFSLSQFFFLYQLGFLLWWNFIFLLSSGNVFWWIAARIYSHFKCSEFFFFQPSLPWSCHPLMILSNKRSLPICSYLISENVNYHFYVWCN